MICHRQLAQASLVDHDHAESSLMAVTANHILQGFPQSLNIPFADIGIGARAERGLNVSCVKVSGKHDDGEIQPLVP
jgi:hypothetical protein